jgi:hypothetical protein
MIDGEPRSPKEQPCAFCGELRSVCVRTVDGLAWPGCDQCCAHDYEDACMPVNDWNAQDDFDDAPIDW